MYEQPVFVYNFKLDNTTAHSLIDTIQAIYHFGILWMLAPYPVALPYLSTHPLLQN